MFRIPSILMDGISRGSIAVWALMMHAGTFSTERLIVVLGVGMGVPRGLNLVRTVNSLDYEPKTGMISAMVMSVCASCCQ